VDESGTETVLDTYGALVEFFSDLGLESARCIYGGLRFETEYRVPPSPRPGFITMEPETRGIYVTVHLGVRLDANALMRSRWGVEAGVTDLHEWFDVDATDEKRLREYLEGGLDAVMVDLARGFDVTLTDDRVQFGPLLGTPEESARALDSLVRALPPPLVPATPFVPAPCARRSGEGAMVAIGWTASQRRARALRDAIQAEGIPCQVDALGDLGLAGKPGGARRWHLLVPDACEDEAVKVLRRVGAGPEPRRR
jgi:hypothetical protein